MTEPESSPTLEELPAEECLRLLAAGTVGRFAVAAEGRPPLVVPVNYVLDGDVIAFRTNPGAKLTALRSQPASFEIDEIDPFHHSGWSVLVQGVAYEATASEIAHLAVEPWVGPRDRWVRLVPTAITGRRIQLPPIRDDDRGYR